MTRSDAIYLELLDALTQGRYGVGDKLPAESALAGKLHASKSSVHDAMRKLEANGIIQRARRGTVLVKAINSADRDVLVRGLTKKAHVIYSCSETFDKVHWSDTALSALEQKLAEKQIATVFHPISATIPAVDFQALLKRIMKDDPVACVISAGGQYVRRYLHDMRNWMIERNTPIYLHHRGGGADFDLPCHSISLDAFADGFTIGDILYQAGYRDAFFLGSAKIARHVWTQLRHAGVRTGLRMAANPAGSHARDFCVNPNEVLKQIQHHARSPVVVAVNNEIAVEFIDAARKRGLTTGRHYHLIAFDDHADYYAYNISSLRVPQGKIGRLFGELILSKSVFTDATHVNIRVKSEYIERQTFRTSRSI